jgi:hypothetical protein
VVGRPWGAPDKAQGLHYLEHQAMEHQAMEVGIDFTLHGEVTSHRALGIDNVRESADPSDRIKIKYRE